MSHIYYSQRKGSNPNQKGLPLADLIDLFGRVFSEMREDGYFHEAFGFMCVDAGHIDGRVRDIELEMLLSVRKKGLWPVHEAGARYSEEDFFDVIEFLFQHVSKPIDGTYHSWNECGTHWERSIKRKVESSLETRSMRCLFTMRSHSSFHRTEKFSTSPKLDSSPSSRQTFRLKIQTL